METTAGIEPAYQGLQSCTSAALSSRHSIWWIVEELNLQGQLRPRIYSPLGSPMPDNPYLVLVVGFVPTPLPPLLEAALSFKLHEIKMEPMTGLVLYFPLAAVALH